MKMFVVKFVDEEYTEWFEIISVDDVSKVLPYFSKETRKHIKSVYEVKRHYIIDMTLVDAGK